MVGVLYTESEDIALVRDIGSVSRNTARAMSTGMRNTGMQCQTGTRSKNYTIDRDIRVGT